MARLIDLDNPDVVFCGHDGAYLRYNIWEELTTVDAVPVVRCKECKYGSKCIMDMIQCKVYDRLHSADWFCAGGERKGGDGDADRANRC